MVKKEKGLGEIRASFHFTTQPRKLGTIHYIRISHNAQHRILPSIVGFYLRLERVSSGS